MLVCCRAEAERFFSLKKINMANNMKGANHFRQEMVEAVVRELALEMHCDSSPGSASAEGGQESGRVRPEESVTCDA